eukprot:6550665-Pyramimonas_sp.AAC.1
MGGRTLTQAEMDDVTEKAKAEYANPAFRSTYAAKYQSQVRARQQGRQSTQNGEAASSSEPQMYDPPLGMGSKGQPLDMKLFIARHAARGFPGDEDVYRPKHGFVIGQADVDALDKLKGGSIKLGACCTSLDGICRNSLTDVGSRVVSQICDYLGELTASLTKPTVCLAETLVMFECVGDAIPRVVHRCFCMLVSCTMKPISQLVAMK